MCQGNKAKRDVDQTCIAAPLQRRLNQERTSKENGGRRNVPPQDTGRAQRRRGSEKKCIKNADNEMAAQRMDSGMRRQEQRKMYVWKAKPHMYPSSAEYLARGQTPNAEARKEEASTMPIQPSSKVLSAHKSVPTTMQGKRRRVISSIHSSNRLGSSSQCEGEQQCSKK
jgi:hypothetical protein